MRHGNYGGKLGRTSAHRQALFRNLVTSLVEHERVETTAEVGSYWRISAGRLRSNRVGMAALGILIVLCLVALCAPLIETYVTHVGPNDQDLRSLFAAPRGRPGGGRDQLGAAGIV